MTNKVLIVDDDEAVIATLKKVMETAELEADAVETGEEALERLVGTKYSLVLLDINLKGIDGFTVIKTLRAKGNTVPVIVVSGRKEDYDTLYGLDIGADDYVTKPFNPVTLGAKAKALIRRCANDSPHEIVAGPFTYDTSTLRLYRNGVEIPLTGKENALMKLFIDNPNRIFPKETLYEMVWGDAVVNENAIMVYINRLRQKIEEEPDSPKYLRTVRGIGYRFVP